MKLERPKCTVRDWARSDRSDLVRFADNRKIWRNLTHMFPSPYTEADADAWFSSLEAMPEPTSWAIEVEGQCRRRHRPQTSGKASSHARPTSATGWASRYWGRGIMTEAAQAVIPAVMEHFGLCRLEAAIFAWNPASMRVLEHCGFVREGISRASVFKDGELIDRAVYALVLP